MKIYIYSLSFTYKISKKIFNKLSTFFLFFVFGNRNFLSKPKLERLGSTYGGWYLCCTNLNEKSRILSLGAGEDISFDTEIANKYGCKVDIFDPTPKAVEHFMLLKKQLGKDASTTFSNTGKQDIRSYNLRNVRQGQISFVPKAVWIEDGVVRFFVPLNENSVSHTITGYNSKTKGKRESILVDCIDILKIKIEKYEVLKLDIEGSELPVLTRKQLLVEFDELRVLNFTNLKNVFLFQRELKRVGYSLVKNDEFNFTYLKD